MSDTSSDDDDVYEDVDSDDTSDDDKKGGDDSSEETSDESSDDDVDVSDVDESSSDEDESNKKVNEDESEDEDDDSSDEDEVSDDDAFISHNNVVNEDDVSDEEFDGDYIIKTIDDSDEECDVDSSDDSDEAEIIEPAKTQPKVFPKSRQITDTSSEDESSDDWSKSIKHKIPTAKSSDSDEDESAKKSPGVKIVAPPKKPAKRQEIKKKPPPLTQEEIEIKKLIDSGDVDDKREAELALRLMKELHCLRKHALIAAHCDNWTEATARVDDLILKDEFIKLRVAEKKAGIAVDLWKQSIVTSKKAAADLANRYSSVKEVLKHLSDEKEKKKKLRRIQANYDLTTEDECLAVVELMAKRHSEEDSVEAVRTAGIDGAEDYLEQLDRHQKTIRRLISNYSLSRAKCLSVIELVELKCDEELAAELIETHDEKEAKAEWQRLTKILKTPQISKKYKEVKKLVKFKRLVLALNLIEFGYDVKDVLMAAECCTSMNEALTIIENKRKCTCCFEEFTVNDMITLSNCQHEMCRECMVNHFTVRIRDHKSVYDVVCPAEGCGDDQQLLDHEYFIMLSNQLQELLNKETYELFQAKLLDNNIQNDERFVYCSRCNGNGFTCPPGLESATCPECQHVMCPKCKGDWEPNHKGRTCDEVKELENTERANELGSVRLIGNVLEQKGIQCPKCKFRFELTRGGCMHFICTSCKHEFCEGCSQELFKAGQCKVFGDCITGGFHGHHPRNCLYYLRDYTVEQLESLFKLSEVEVPASRFEAGTGQCQVIEGDATGKEQACGKPSNENQKEFCDKHYKEHLVLSINAQKLDPAHIMDVGGLTAELRIRNRKDVPDKVAGEEDNAYRTRLLQAVIAEVPLDFKWKNRE